MVKLPEVKLGAITDAVKSAGETVGNAAAGVAESSVGAALSAKETVENASIDDVKKAAVSVGKGAQSAAVAAADAVAANASFVKEQGVEGIVSEGKRRGVLNRRLKETAMDNLQKASDSYEQWILDLASVCESLYDEKVSSVEALHGASEYVTSIANRPKEFDDTFANVEYEISQFSEYVLEIEQIDRDWSIRSGAAMQAGAAASAGVVALGPAAAMGIATTFGTASTGVAISSLSGAAATSAATAWLGGGALAVGGGGMAAGGHVLAFLGGPAGWILGGAGLVASTAIASKGNKDVAEKAEKRTGEIVVEISKVKVAISKASLLREEIESLEGTLGSLVEELKRGAPSDYAEFAQDDKHKLLVLVNTARSLSAKLNEVIS